MLNYDELVNRDGSINWDKVPVDTPIKVKQKRDSKWQNMCFAKYEFGQILMNERDRINSLDF